MIKPALSLEEWECWLFDSAPDTDPEQEIGSLQADMLQDASESGAHGGAAIRLYGKPYGFGQKDVEALRWAATELEGSNDHQHLDRLRSIADRIEALIPPVGWENSQGRR